MHKKVKENKRKRKKENAKETLALLALGMPRLG